MAFIFILIAWRLLFNSILITKNKYKQNQKVLLGIGYLSTIMSMVAYAKVVKSQEDDEQKIKYIKINQNKPVYVEEKALEKPVVINTFKTSEPKQNPSIIFNITGENITIKKRFIKLNSVIKIY